ncbi:MAG: DUF935 family protein [Phycisphaerales bacterium]|nr:MAG: DUF935 family protein [Phycisphaerales bacterium]
MSITQRLVNAVRGRMPVRPRPGTMIVPRPEDAQRDYLSSGLTPSRLIAILRQADDGFLSSAMQLYEEMEEKDPHLYSVAHTRRLAVTNAQWQILSAADVHVRVDRAAADEAADYCRRTLAGLESFERVLRHLSLAVGRNIAVAELVWDIADGRLALVDVAPVAFERLIIDDVGRPRILTEGAPQDGIALPPNKFIVHTPHAASGYPQRGGLLRVTAMTYLAKNLTLKDWLIFSEIFGMPVRIARYENSATPEEKKELLNMLETLGSNAAGVFSRAVELQFVEAGRGTSGPPYLDLVNFLNREMSKAWLGQTLTTETTGAAGTLTASEVHDRVRQDIREDDLRSEAATLRRDLLAPLTHLRFGPDVPVPVFTRKPPRPRDAVEFTQVLDSAVRNLGLAVPQAWVREILGIPAPKEGEPVLERGGRGETDRT